MCRHLAYLGAPRYLADLVLTPKHGLLRQSYQPRDMRGGATINADGFGVGWYPLSGLRAGRLPVRYRSSRPLWADESFAQIASATEACGVLAAIRSATEGMALVHTACAPFTEGRWLFSHNGVVTGWPRSVAALAATLPITDLITLDAPTDSALLWALARHQLRADVDPARALVQLVTAVADAAPGSRLNLLLTDGATVYATAWGHALVSRSSPDGLVVASESHDDQPDWIPVPNGYLLFGTAAQGAMIRPIEGFDRLRPRTLATSRKETP
ncbi:MAG: ergothioneine biosynthesis protein EgtC [Pseudonocardia sp.]|nr:ergothioneine biosynthesis protein EgtC [Pseudonocardia sp.]